jgi:hypothetical protein
MGDIGSRRFFKPKTKSRPLSRKSRAFPAKTRKRCDTAEFISSTALNMVNYFLYSSSLLCNNLKKKLIQPVIFRGLKPPRLKLKSIPARPLGQKLSD